MIKNKFIIFAASFLIMTYFFSCREDNHNHANHHMNETSFEKLAESFESKERDIWQKPEEVIQFINKAAFGNAKNGFVGKKIADLGSGTGYFSVRFLDKGGNVIALDIDERFLKYIENRTKSHPKKNFLELGKIAEGDTGLKDNEVDLIFTVNTYHHFENRVNFFSKLKKSMKSDGRIVVIDFKEGELPVHSPPESMKVKKEVILKELGDAGFEVNFNDTILEYQNIFIANVK